ncbi:hypothetical protein L249_2997 [Ophiocordyceps polyrhachis-furcata BCC 54312]|uniref:Zeta toxin domain-containing protein n=1 Tax=Ophiocordyceps polyrhachis-furcata BCC 54312 TaxID=1330021 RepID=A0A367LNH6_9HYPO|nr:hypothetical protein L249_2997 [Ophiocordyceps polyrhachis-furcata BCC 54312]
MMASSYRLSDAESQQIFRTRIVPAEVAAAPDPTSRHRQPFALLIVGQIGAGKSTLSPRLLAALRGEGEGGPVTHLVADAFKRYHPAYASLLSSSSSPPALASAATGPDARRWLIMAAEEVARRKGNVLIESACRYVEDFKTLLEIFGSGGGCYGLCVVFLAVPLALSRLGIAMRFYTGSESRLTPAVVHDQSCDGLLRAAAFVDGDDPAVAFRLLVLRRDGNVVFCPPGGLVDALTAERGRRLRAEERETVDRELGLLKTCGSGHAAKLADEIGALLLPLTEGGDDALTVVEVRPLEIKRGTGEDGQAWNVLRLP